MGKHNNQLDALWREAGGKGQGGMKAPMGFSGSGIWAILIVLVVGVIWVRNEYGAQWAGGVLIAVGVIVFIILWELIGIARRQAEASLEVAKLQATAPIERERIKGENIVQKYDAQMRAKEFGIMLATIAKTIRSNNSGNGQPALTGSEEEEGDFWDMEEVVEGGQYQIKQLE